MSSKGRASKRYLVSLVLASLVLACLLLPRAAEAGEVTIWSQDVSPFGEDVNYSSVLYDNMNGLPTSEANDIAQTEEGFIWIGSYGGLTRFDGSTFERMNSTTGIGNVACLYADTQNRLWIGTNDNGLAMLDHGQRHTWGVADGLGSTKITDIEEGDDGTIYVGTTSGIAMIAPDLTLSTSPDNRVSMSFIDSISRGRHGLVYCLTNEDDYFTLRKGVLVEYVDHTKTSIDGITHIYSDPSEDGMVYIGTEGGELHYGNPKRDLEGVVTYDVSPLVNISYIAKVGDRVWICARNGIGVIDAGKFYCYEGLPLDSNVNHVMEDYEGNLWFTSSRQGVMKLTPNRFQDVFERYELPERVVNSTCMLDGELYVGTDTGLVVIGKDGPVSSVPLASARTISGRDLGTLDLVELLDGCRIRSVLRDEQDRLWISTWRSLGLLRYDHGVLTSFTTEEGLPSDHIRAVRAAKDGSTVVACTGGVSVIEDDRVKAVYGRDEGIANVEILTVEVAPNGDIIAGTDGGGIYVIDGKGTVRHVGTEDGLSSQIVMRVKHDPTYGLFWLVTSNSISYMSEDYAVTTVSDFPYSNNFDLYENSQGDMWVLSSDGIYVVPTEELVANGELRCAHYGMSNGIPYTTTSNSYSELTDEGDLYIAGNKGVIRLNVELPLEDVTALKKGVPFVEADGVTLYPDESGSFTLPARVRKLTVHAHVYTHSLTDPQITYQLTGFDTEKTTVSRRDFGPVSYTNLPGGTYQFVMEVKDALGRQGDTLTVTIVKEKALHEQTWFYVASFGGGLLLAAALVRHYVRRKMTALEEKHREEAERERISNELAMANEIQASMLPHVFPPFPDRKEFELFASMDPAREVGGDFYDFFLVDDDHLCLVMADVSGKGIPAALFMMISKVILQSFATTKDSAASVLTRANEALCSDNQTNMFVTVWLGILEISTGRLVAANAGHEYPAIKRAGGPYELLKDKHGLMVGVMEGIRYKEYELSLEPGDQIFLYTDGVPEAANIQEEMFGMERMVEALNSEPGAHPEQILENVRAAVDLFAGGAEQYDDLTMLCVEYRGTVAA